jgi:hypothetical protein
MLRERAIEGSLADLQLSNNTCNVHGGYTLTLDPKP